MPIRVHAKFTLNFLDLSTSFSRISKFKNNFWNYLNKKGNEKGLNGAWAESAPWPGYFGVAACGAGRTGPLASLPPLG
jgi:hypothetical protein